MVFPYLSLQMFNIGMNYNEIAIIMGAVQAISFVGTPITGYARFIYIVFVFLNLFYVNCKILFLSFKNIQGPGKMAYKSQY
jgi:hypothetical protein